MPRKLPNYLVAFVVIVCVCFELVVAQENNYRGASYPFVREDLNEIENGRKGLRHFYRQLSLLESRQKQQINIVHIGDSHIQADWFSGIVRMELQQRFGSAGRGLVFPYAVANTNGPIDIYSSSNLHWESRRNSRSYPQDLRTGVSGMGIRSENANFQLKFRLTDNPYNLDYSFNRVTLFAEQGPINFDIQISPEGKFDSRPLYTQLPTRTGRKRYHVIQSGENLTKVAQKYNLTIEEIMQLNDMESTVIYAGDELLVSKATSKRYSRPALGSGATSSFMLPISDRSLINNLHSISWETPGMELYLKGKKNNRLQSQSILYGMVLENTYKSGILYHMIGVNGAEFKHFNRSGNFWRQVKGLNPDLIIISLGTNESVHYNFNANNFFEEIDEFVEDLERNIPFTEILFTTPPEALRSGRKENPTVRRCKNILLSYSLANELACWDFFEIMGGPGSIHQWKDAYLAQEDYLHLTRTGYELQGKLLFRALMKGYEDFRMAESQ